MNTTNLTHTETAGRRFDEDARADARGMVFLVGMLVAGALTIAATLTVGTPSASEATPGTSAPVATR